MSKHRLAIDFGNSRVKLAIFKKEKLIDKIEQEDFKLDELISLTTNHQPRQTIFSATGLVDEELRRFLINELKALELTHRTPLPIRNKYQTPETLGKDRVAAAVGAYYQFPGRHCLIVDAGTCITYDWLDQKGNYLGGNIAPGISMRLKAMHTFTARLPLVEMSQEAGFVGRNTREAIQNGAQEGALLELKGYIRWGEKKFEQLTVAVTGGDMDFFVKNLKRKIFARPNLVLYGLNKILEFNVE